MDTLGSQSHGVAIASNACVSVVAALARCLALEHLAVLGNAVTLALGNRVLFGNGVVLSGGPGKVITTDLDVIVGELAELVVVHTEEFGFFRGAEMKTGDLVDAEGEERAHDECVGSAGHNVRDLNVHLLPVVVDPSSLGDTVVHSIETDNVGCSENAVEEKTDHTGDTVLSEDIESIIDLNPELDFGKLSV